MSFRLKNGSISIARCAQPIVISEESPSMTQDEPERVEVEEILTRLRALSAAMSEQNMDMQLPPGMIDPEKAAYDLGQIISTSEKRAEEAAAALSADRRGYQAYIDATSEQRDFAIIAQPEAEKKLSTALVISNNYQSLMVTAQRERDESRSSLARVVEALTQAASCGWDRLRLEAEIRSALHMSQGE